MLRGRRGTFYGITLMYRKDPRPLHEDLPKIFSMFAENNVDAMVAATFPLLEARRALDLLATGAVEGVLTVV